LAILEAEKPVLLKSIQQLISMRLFNHVYSDLILVAASPLCDAQACERSAFEAIAAFQLVSLCPEYEEQDEKRRISEANQGQAAR
jgi:hypothetical protein